APNRNATIQASASTSVDLKPYRPTSPMTMTPQISPKMPMALRIAPSIRFAAVFGEHELHRLFHQRSDAHPGARLAELLGQVLDLRLEIGTSPEGPGLALRARLIAQQPAIDPVLALLLLGNAALIRASLQPLLIPLAQPGGELCLDFIGCRVRKIIIRHGGGPPTCAGARRPGAS